MKKAIVIGAGIAGIASALRLRKKGFVVHVFEGNAYAGGKLHAYQLNRYRFDAGPSLFTMPQLVDELFALHDKNPRDYFNYKKKEIVCHYFWDDDTQFTMPADEQAFIKQAAHVFSESTSNLQAYLNRNKDKYDLTADIFLNKSLHRWSTYLNATTLNSLIQAGKLHLNQTLDEVNQSYFSHPKLVQLFNRYATYNGSSPYQTPGIMSLIPHLEMHFGTYYPAGGMHQISQQLYKLAQEVGVHFNFNEPVTSILCQNNKAYGIVTAKGENMADIVVSNMDIFSTYHKLLPQTKPPKKVLQQERSSSAIIFYWGIKESFHQLDLHNIFFTSDYQQEFKALFENHRMHDDPTVYINITSKEDQQDAPPNCENWFVMVNAPANYGQDWEQLIAQAKVNIIQKINKILKTDIAPLIEVEDILHPLRIEQLTSSHRGSLYGTSSNSKFAAFLRHPNFSNRIKNLYFCGGSVHPGGGIPLCLLSAKIAIDQIH